LTTPAAAATKPRPAAGQQAAPPPPQAFRVGVYDAETPDYDQTATMTTGTVNFPNYVVTPNGWLRGFWALFECVTAGNSANVAFTADAPFNTIQKVTFLDVGNREVFGPIGGYDWETVMKYGGYFEIGDPRSDPTFSATTGSGATGGSFTIVMYMPVEVVQRDGLGDIENKSSSSSYKIQIVLNASGQIYSTAPTTLGTVRLRITSDGYTEPEATDGMGRPLAQAPPAAGTIQYWAQEDVTLNAGSAKYLIQNGLGYSIRNLIFKLVDSNNSRAQGDSDWPDPVTLTFGKVQLFQRYKTIWISRMGKNFGLTSASTDASLGRENGVFPVWFTRDFGFKPGAELRNGYLVTKPGNVLQWAGTIGGTGTHTLFVLVNYVIPPGNDPANLRARAR
jgi:hypothetical protein